MKQRWGLWATIAWLGFGSVNFAQAADLSVQINRAESTLNYAVTYADILFRHKIPSINFRVRGSVVDAAPNLLTPNLVYVSLSSNRVMLSQGAHQMAVDIIGRIGFTPALTSAIPVLLPPEGAQIDLVGDLDESTVGLNTPPGPYVGVLTITASSL